MARESKFTINELYTSTKELLLLHGYAGFHFGLLAEKLNVTRGALYKYFDNKDELITEFMDHEMEQFMLDLEKIKMRTNFEEQLDYLLDVIFKNSKIHQILSIIYQIPKSSHKNVNKTLKRLDEQHHKMYGFLNDFIQLGRKENCLKSEFPDHLILGFIFQTVNIPNHSQLPEEEWRNLVKQFLYYGMSAK